MKIIELITSYLLENGDEATQDSDGGTELWKD